MITFRAFLFICWMVLVTAVLGAAGEKPWIEVRSPHFRVLTNGAPGDARHVAEEFEQLRYVFASRFPNLRLESGAPLTIFAARDADTAKALEPGTWKVMGPGLGGEFNTGWGKQYAMVRLDIGSGPWVSRPEPARVRAGKGVRMRFGDYRTATTAGENSSRGLPQIVVGQRLPEHAARGGLDLRSDRSVRSIAP